MLKQLLSFGFVESISKALNFLVLLLLPLFLPVKEFGIVGIIVSIENLLSSMLLFGQDRVILRYYSFENDKKSFIFTVLFPWSIITVLLLFLSLTVIHFYFSGGIYGIRYWPDLVLLAVIVILTSFRFIFIAVVRTQTNFKQFSIDKLIFQILKISIVVLFALRLKTSSSYIYGVFIALIVVFILEFFYLKNYTLINFEKKKIKRNWNFGSPFVLHVMAGNVLIYFSRFVLEKYASMETVALYTFASNIGMGISFVYAAFIVFFEPQIYKHSNDIEKSEKWLGLFSLSTMAINAILIVVILLLAPTIINSYFNREYLKIIPILPIILAAISLNAIYLQSSYRLTIYEKTQLIPLATIIAGIFNIVLNILLVPKLGLYGAAVTMFFSYLVLLSVTFIFSIMFTSLMINDVIGKKYYFSIIIINSLFIIVNIDIEFYLTILIIFSILLFIKLFNTKGYYKLN